MPRNQPNGSSELKYFAEIIESVKSPIGVGALCILVLGVFALSVSVGLKETNQSLLIQYSMMIIALVVVGTLGLAAFRPHVLGVSDPPSSSRPNDLQRQPLDTAIGMTLGQKQKINTLRIAALTSGQIAPLANSAINPTPTLSIFFIAPNRLTPDIATALPRRGNAATARGISNPPRIA